MQSRHLDYHAMVELKQNTSKDILLELVALCDPDTLECNMSMTTIQKHSKYNQGTIRSHIRILEKAGIVTTIRSYDKKPNLYIIIKNYKDFIGIYEKICSKCNRLQSVDNFAKKNSIKDFRTYGKTCKECVNKLVKHKYYNNIEYKLTCICRSRLRDALKGKCKSKKTMELVGCGIDALKKHIELKFQDGMSWDNYGKWHIDHIRPCSSFDLTDAKQQEECFHYTNLQPLWAAENLQKGSKWQNTTSE